MTESSLYPVEIRRHPCESEKVQSLHSVREIESPQSDSQQTEIEKAFENRGHWIEDPVTSQWSSSRPDISANLKEINELYDQWRTSGPGPFCPFSDPLWLQSCEVLQDVGLPWLNNNLNLPDEIDPSWPFQFKHFEREVVITKGARVGDMDASGYICTGNEGNIYAIRALQQELRRQRPLHKPLLVANRIDPEILITAAEMFGLETYQVEDDWGKATKGLQRLTVGGRPIIFIATMANEWGQPDDFDEISKLSQLLPMFLHVDASRNFDFVTSLPESVRRKLGIPRLRLLHLNLDEPSSTCEEPTISAATIMAAGMNCTRPPPVVVLRPKDLGSPLSRKIEYLKGSDNTLCGSRDGIGPLLMYIQEQRFTADKRKEIYARCMEKQQRLISKLKGRNVRFRSSVVSLDVVVYPERLDIGSLGKTMGLHTLDDGGFLLTIQPGVTAKQVDFLAEALCGNGPIDYHLVPSPSNLRANHPIPGAVVNNLRSIMDHWHHSAKRSGGYCLNQATYAAIGPIIGPFLPVYIPPEWTRLKGIEILEGRKSSFGLSDKERKFFAASFTTGSTMGNRIGLYTALKYCPNACIYYSKSIHYSFKKIVGDNDILTGRWTDAGGPRFVEVAADDQGRMIPEDLVKEVAKNKSLCASRGQPHEVVLLITIGTTFTGGRDDIFRLRQALDDAGLKVSYIHADGALDFGFSSDSVRLGSPGEITRNNLPVVQGITMSHHKAFGLMVSGEVICYSPTDQQLANAVSDVDPRVVFETWLFQKMYSPSDWQLVNQCCNTNARRLRSRLEAAGLRTRYNEESYITVMERPPAWLLHRYHLAPEGGWVHYITMPHVSSSAVDEFVTTMALFDRTYAAILREVERKLILTIGQDIGIVRISCHDSVVFSKIFAFYQRTHTMSPEPHRQSEICGEEDFRSRFAHSAISFAALDQVGEPLMLFLSESELDKTICSQPVFMRKDLICSRDKVHNFFVEALDSLASALDLTLIHDG
ncbi:MAG: hypothetical protein L6R41_007858 [Letrouitia leprolyta]|nr:MAG: hypothetical protein L6R41_007858 [Letrouitia leprolyta]